MAFVAAAALLIGTPGSAETLQDAIVAAFTSNPQLAAARARQGALAEQPEQARALGRPTAEVSGAGGYDRLNFGTAAFATTSATLPIWTGGRVRSAVRAATGDVAAGAQGLRDTEAAILETVIDTYADLLYNQQALEIARVGIARLDRQVTEARLRYDLGQATRTDVAQLEAQRASVAASLADAEGELERAAAAYRSAVGHDAGRLSADIPAPVALPATRDAARREAVGANPQLLRQQRIVEASAARIDQARADGAPSIDLAVSYGRGGLVADGLHGFDSAAAVGLTYRIPLLTGGLVSSRIREAQATNRAEQFQAEAAEREAVRATDTSWAALAAAKRRLRENRDGLSAADLALNGVRAEYGFGLRTTTDILVADQSFRGAQLAVALAQADVLIAEAALLRATGQLGRDTFM